jgi:predicted anti-sigma-YlaC factor YlaD
MKRHPDRSALRDHALGAPAAPRTAAHLASCEDCRRSLQAEQTLARRIEEELASALDVAPGPGFEALLRARIAKRRVRTAYRSTSFGWIVPLTQGWRGGLAATGLAVLLAIGVATLTRVRPGEPPTGVPDAARVARRHPSDDVTAVPPPGTGRQTAQPGARSAAAAAEAATRVVAAGAAADAATARAASGPQPTPPGSAAVEPEVLVPPAEALALARFVAGRQRWRLARVPEGPVAPLASPPSLVIAPLAFEPLAAED